MPKKIDQDETTNISCQTQNQATIKKQLPIAKYSGKLPIGDIELSCVVLDDSRRIFPAASIFRAFDRPRRGPRERDPKIETDDGLIQLPAFVGGRNLTQYISDELLSLFQVVEYLDGKNTESGYQAEILPELCSLYLKARREGKITPDQEKIAAQAEILAAAFAKVGIVALVDEATGFQKDRTNNALQILLQKYVNESIQKWVKTFPDDFFSQLDRLYAKEHTTSRSRPPYYGKFINTYIYEPIENGRVKFSLQFQNRSGLKVPPSDHAACLSRRCSSIASAFR